MEIKLNEKIDKIVYDDYLPGGKIKSSIENGVIVSNVDLISPVRDVNNIQLTSKEPHIIFKDNNGKFTVIPAYDIKEIIYK